MTAPSSTTPRSPADETVSGVGRFGTRSALGWAALLLGAVPFLLLWLLVQRRWSPLAGLDGNVAAGLNDAVSDSAGLVDTLRVVTDLGGTEFAVLAFVLMAAFLAIRRHWRLVAFVAVTGPGLALLGPATKAIVDRARPVVDVAVVQTPSNASFPSGHAMTSVVLWGTLLLLALPAVGRRTRPWLVGAAVIIVLAVSFTRLALGVHFVSDVLAGWALGVGWLAVTAGTFRAWQHSRGRYPHEPLSPLDLDPDEAPHLVWVAEPHRHVRATAARLIGTAAVLVGTMSALGLLVTAVLTDTWVGRLDRSIVASFADERTAFRSDLATAVSSLSGTWAVIAIGLSAAVLALAATGRRRPALFVVVALVGEVLLYVVVAQIVGRLRPDVADLTSGLPIGASWPSGHSAAAAALYAAVAVLVLASSRSPWRWAVLALPVLLAPAIGISRLYVAAHYPTDVIAGLILGGAWVLACARFVLRPAHDTAAQRFGTADGRASR